MGKDATALNKVRDQITAMLKEGAPAPDGDWDVLNVFEPVAGHKSRHPCVLLPFEAVTNALGD